MSSVCSKIVRDSFGLFCGHTPVVCFHCLQECYSTSCSFFFCSLCWLLTSLLCWRSFLNWRQLSQCLQLLSSKDKRVRACLLQVPRAQCYQHVFLTVCLSSMSCKCSFPQGVPLHVGEEALLQPLRPRGGKTLPVFNCCSLLFCCCFPRKLFNFLGKLMLVPCLQDHQVPHCSCFYLHTHWCYLGCSALWFILTPLVSRGQWGQLVRLFSHELCLWVLNLLPTHLVHRA